MPSTFVASKQVLICVTMCFSLSVLYWDKSVIVFSFDPRELISLPISKQGSGGVSAGTYVNSSAS